MIGMKMMRALRIGLVIAAACVPVNLAWGQATILPNGLTCMQATTGLTGMVGTLGSITGGSSYTNGTYGGVTLTGGTGSGATANITVSGGVVSGVTILAPGTQYTVGDVLSASAASLGGTGSGFSVPLLSISINSSLAGGTVGFYTPNTLTFKTTWRNAAQTLVNTNPVRLDQNGCALIYGLGSYRQIVKDSLGNTVWDAITQSTATSVPTPATSGAGDFLAIGSVIAIAGFSSPTNYVMAYGQALSRVTYPDALTAITISSSATCSSGSASITGISSTSQMRVGAPIESACLPSSTTIATIAGATSITTSNNATVSGTNTIRVFPWGNGDGSTTFNVPDLRGRVLPGPDAMGGTAANRLISTYFGTTCTAAGVSAGPPASAGGIQNCQLAQTNLPNVNFTVSGITLTNPAPAAITTSNLGNLEATTVTPAAGTTVVGISTGGAPISLTHPTQATSVATQGVASSGGVATAFSIIQPSLTINYAIKVLNGTLPVVGVLSLGGMTGDINCGTGLSCAGQIISAEALVAGAATIYMNATAGPAAPAFNTIQGLTLKAVPDANNDMVILWDSVAGTLKRVTPGAISSIGVSGVSSLGGQTGALTCSDGVLCAAGNVSAPGPTINVKTAAVPALGNSNGTTGNGHDDTAAIQAAFNLSGRTVNGANYRTVYFPCGTYRITSTITGNDAETSYTIVGEGACSQIYLDNAGADVAFQFSSPNASGPNSSCGGNNTMPPCITVKGIHFSSPTTSAGSLAIELINNPRALIRDNIFHLYGKGIELTNSFGPVIETNLFLRIEGQSIDCTNDNSCNNATIQRNGSFAGGLVTGVGQIEVGPNVGASCPSVPNGISISNNDISYGYYGMIFFGACAVEIRNNYIELNTQCPFAWQSGGINSAFSFVSNWVYGKSAILCDIANLVGATFDLNTFFDAKFAYASGTSALTWGFNSKVGATVIPFDCPVSAGCFYAPGGKLYQTGFSTTSASTPGTVNVTFPISCPSALLGVGADGLLNADMAVNITAASTSGISIRSSVGSATVSWYALCN